MKETIKFKRIQMFQTRILGNMATTMAAKRWSTWNWNDRAIWYSKKKSQEENEPKTLTDTNLMLEKHGSIRYIFLMCIPPCKSADPLGRACRTPRLPTYPIFLPTSFPLFFLTSFLPLFQTSDPLAFFLSSFLPFFQTSEPPPATSWGCFLAVAPTRNLFPRCQFSHCFLSTFFQLLDPQTLQNWAKN